MKNIKNIKPPRKPIFYYYGIILLVILLMNAFLLPAINNIAVKEVDYGTFLRMVESGQVEKVNIENNVISFTAFDSKDIYKTGVIDDAKLVDRLYEANVTFTRIVPREMSPLLNFFLSWILPLLIFIAIGQWLMKKMANRLPGGGNALSFGKSNAKVYVEAQTGKSFQDVAGQDEAKEALHEIVDFLHNPKKYTEIGASIPKGALLVGPPGTGKTLLAKAVAGESKVPFFSISGSEFVEMFVGMGAARVRDLFKQAQEKAPCIVFIDEIDAIGKSRNAGMAGGNDEREQTLNQLLTEMDGFDADKGVVILAATNRPETLDKALLRPGRFDRRVPVELPDLIGREAILQVHAKKVKMAEEIDLRVIARATPGASGADLANIVNEAALRAVKLGRSKVTQQDLEESVEVVIAGYQRKSTLISMKDKLTIAYHEVGHALVAAKQSDSAPARAMVTRYGMSEAFDMMALETVNNPYLGGDTSLLVSAETASRIDDEVLSIIKACHQKALTILEENKAKLHEITKYLMEKETITGDEFMHILQREEPHSADGHATDD